ncbi:hypothetical protein ABZ816_26365 [Actinosynnema sp. NPDC047251]|uniref:Putative membrane protein n=1 Tax=Saccharothrix espanaensis (strain ATCC 51144 / DSM 44229 / JCM 9112 / NBRC 15066 / NRRL 15764) TaxID=1179773 RepID=K0K5H3_SACES|nr:hypothetical protein [Saccharothrix espanaensis]CCH32084.1 putative membrane protein [Saccharothrix espanaensis DSM 44229]
MPAFTDAVTAADECTRSDTGKLLCAGSWDDALITVLIIAALTTLLLLAAHRHSRRRRRDHSPTVNTADRTGNTAESTDDRTASTEKPGAPPTGW